MAGSDERSGRCSARRVRASEADLDRIEQAIPDDLLDLPKWICWDGRLLDSGKLSKAPINPLTGGYAKSNAPSTWGTFDQAAERALNDARVGGLALVLTDAEVWGLDFDHVLDPESHELLPSAEQLFDALSSTYVEISPSGDGLHSLFRGALPGELRKARVNNAFGEGTNLEIFGGASACYLTITGDALFGVPRPPVEPSKDDISVLASMLASSRPSPREVSGLARTRSVSSATSEERQCELASALYSIPASLSRPGWLRVIHAVHAAFRGDPVGAKFVEEWSSKTPIKNQHLPGEATRAYRKARLPEELHDREPVTEESLFKLAREHRWRIAWIFEDVEDSERDREGFPSSSLPPVCRQVVREGAWSQGVDVEFWAVPLLGILAGCIGATRTIRLKADWFEPAVLWTAIVAPSGSGKSPPLKELLRPVREHDLALHARYRALQKLHEAELASRKGKKGQEPKPEPPPLLAAIVNDVTLEALIARIADNPRGLLLGVDELAGWLRSFNKYRKGGGDEQSWLSIHDANSVKVDRKGSGGSPQRIYVPRAAVSVVGTIQPGIARQSIASEENRASGMAARLLLAAPPVTSAKWSNREIGEDVRANYGLVIQSLLELDFRGKEPIALPLDAAAQDLFVEFHDANGEACGAAIREGEGDLAAVLSKLRAAAARIALTLALAEAAEAGEAAKLDCIEEQSMSAGIRVAQFFEGEARKLYRLWREPVHEEGRRARDRSDRPESLHQRVIRVLSCGDATRGAIRDALHRNVAAREISEALNELQGLGKVESRSVTRGESGRRRQMWGLTEKGREEESRA